MSTDVKKILQDITFGIGLDPDHRLAADPSDLSDQKTILLLSRYAAINHIPGEIAAKSYSPAEIEKMSDNELLLLGASVLRDCYGKIDHIVYSAQSVRMVNCLSRILKTYKKSLRVIVVNTEDKSTFPTVLPDDIDLHLIDEAIGIDEKDAIRTCEDIAKIENLTVEKTAGALLYAAKELALRINDPHARIIVLYPDK